VHHEEGAEEPEESLHSAGRFAPGPAPCKH
jgi:hypothetical protein